MYTACNERMKAELGHKFCQYMPEGGKDKVIKAVIFDMDGVIIDSEGKYLEYIYEFAREKKQDVRIEELYGTVGATKRDCWEIVERAVGNGQSWEELRREYHERGIWKRAFEEVDYRAIFRPEILSVMDGLKEAGLKLAVASSTGLEQVKRILTMNRVWERLETAVSGEMFKRSKPDPEIYLHTAAQLGVAPSQCLAVEDSTVGITAAKAAGMKVAALIDDRFGFDRSLADRELADLRELPGLVRRLMELEA